MQHRSLVTLVIPDGALLLLAAALVHWSGSTPEAQVALRLYPPAVLAAGVFMGWRYGKGRLLLAFAGLVVVHTAMRWLVPFDVEAVHAGPVVMRALAILLPLSLAALAWVPERGLTTPAGWRRAAILAILVAMVLLVWLLTAIEPAGVAGAFDLPLVPVAWLASLPLGQPASAAALVGILALAVRALWKPDAESRGFLWAAVACLMALSTGPATARATAHLANAGLVLVVASIEGVYALAYRDELTGLPARRALNDALLGADGRLYTVAMVDVDHFKQFNDTHGHDVGDQVLRMVAAQLGRVSGGGRAYRYGGEEFAVVFPGRTAAESAPHLESLRAAVAGVAFVQRDRDRPAARPASPRQRSPRTPLAVTVSIGAAQARGDARPDEVVKAADRALYRAKEGGRNRVVL